MGVNRPGGEYGCVSGNVWDPADGSGNNQATITAMLAWKINAVRIPLNEDCWLSLNGVKTGGTTYQSTIQTWVNLLLQNNIYPILDLHWTENNGAQATGQQPMPDMAHAPTFWGQVAAAYKDSPKVIFDLFNEPYPDNNMEATAAWTCWRDGGTCTGMSYAAAGMQSMVTAVRNAGANNLILLGGIEYSNDLSQWLTYKPTDPANNFAASWHVYPNSNYTSGHTLMMDAMGVAGMVPIVATEIGGVLSGCTATSGTDDGSFITMAMSYLDGLYPPQSYVAWSWSTDDTPVLISNYNGTASAAGRPTRHTCWRQPTDRGYHRRMATPDEAIEAAWETVFGALARLRERWPSTDWMYDRRLRCVASSIPLAGAAAARAAFAERLPDLLVDRDAGRCAGERAGAGRDLRRAARVAGAPLGRRR